LRLPTKVQKLNYMVQYANPSTCRSRFAIDCRGVLDQWPGGRLISTLAKKFQMSLTGRKSM
jgi:hypothetical protein